MVCGRDILIITPRKAARIKMSNLVIVLVVVIIVVSISNNSSRSSSSSNDNIHNLSSSNFSVAVWRIASHKHLRDKGVRNQSFERFKYG